MNTEAQWNIRETVQSLLQSGQVNLVALEGATEDIELQPFVDYPHRKPVELAADYLLKENKISGPIHAALTAQGQLPRFMGIDDAVHYQANIQAYRDSAPKLETAQHQVKNLQAGIDEQKGRDFSVALRSFDQQVQGYRKGQVSLGDYVNTLVNATPSLPSPAIRTFLQALQMERTLDFHQVESERARLVEQLTGQLTPAEIQSLLAQTVAHRSGELGYGDFYAHLKRLCQEKGIRLSDYPAMDAYVRYVLLAEEINAENLLEDMAVLEKSAYARLAVTPEEKALVERSRQTHLMEKLVDFSLTPNEWRDYQSTGPHKGRFDLSSFESFYQEAEARDDAMSKNVMGALVSGPPSSVTVLVTGGFHAERMAHQLTQKGVTVLSYVPKINKIDTTQGSSYLSVFTQEKTPLEKLFQGEKLFLAQNPFSEFAERYLSFWSLAQAFWAGKGKVSNEERNELNKIKGAPPRAELHFVFDRGALYLKIGNKKFLIIGKDGTLFLGLNNVLPVQDTPVKSGGILWFLGGKLRPERSWWVETLALVFSGIVLVLVGQGFTQFGGDLSSWRGILSPIGLAMGGDVPSLLRVLGGLFIGAHVIEYAYYRIFKKGRSPALKNTVFSVLIAFPLFLIPFLDFSSLNSLLVAVVLKPLWHKTVNEWNSGQRPTIVSRPNPNTLTPWRVLVRDPMREQFKWFVGIIVGGTYLLASNLVLFVGGGFPLFFFALVAFGVLLTKKVAPIFLAREHVSYSEEERKALLPIAEKISYWTLGAFILTYFALCPWGLNGIAETGQFFGFISSPPAKTFVLSAMAGSFVGLVKHMMHNARTFYSLDNRPFQKNLLPLSRTLASNREKGMVMPNQRYPMEEMSGSRRAELLVGYYELARRILAPQKRSQREALIRALMEKLEKDAPVFYGEYREILSNHARLAEETVLLEYLLNKGIFAPLNANPFGFRDPQTQGGRRWVDLNPASWEGMFYLGRKIIWAQAADISEKRWLFSHGVGILPATMSDGVVLAYLKNLSGRQSLYHGEKIVIDPNTELEKLFDTCLDALFGRDFLLMKSMDLKAKNLAKAHRIKERGQVVRYLKDVAYTELLHQFGPASDVSGGEINNSSSDQIWVPNRREVIEAVVLEKSTLRGQKKSPEEQVLPHHEEPRAADRLVVSGRLEEGVPSQIAANLSGLRDALQFLRKNKEYSLALIMFTQAIKSFYINNDSRHPVSQGSVILLVRENFHPKLMPQFLFNHAPEDSVNWAIRLIDTILQNNFLSQSAREREIGQLKVAREKQRKMRMSEISPPLGDRTGPTKSVPTLQSSSIPAEPGANSVPRMITKKPAIVAPSSSIEIEPSLYEEAEREYDALVGMDSSRISTNPTDRDNYIQSLSAGIKTMVKICDELIPASPDRESLSQQIEDLRTLMVGALNFLKPGSLITTLRRVGEYLGMTEVQTRFLGAYAELSRPSEYLSLENIALQMGISEEEARIIYSSLGNFHFEFGFPLKEGGASDKTGEGVVTSIENRKSKGLTLPVLVHPDFVDQIPLEVSIKKILLARLVDVEEQIVHGRQLKARSEHHRKAQIYHSSSSGYDLFAIYEKGAIVVLWFGPRGTSHGARGRTKDSLDRRNLVQANDIRAGMAQPILFETGYFPSGNGHASSSPGSVNSVGLGVPDIYWPLIIGIIVSLVSTLLGVGYGPGLILVLSFSAVAFGFEQGGLDRVIEFAKNVWGKIIMRDPSVELVEVLALSDQGERFLAAQQVIELLNETSSKLDVESISGPRALKLLEMFTQSRTFSQSAFQVNFFSERERVFPEGFPLVRARRAVGGLALDGTTQVGPGGLAADVDMKTKKGLVAVVTREMLKDLSTRVGTFEKAAQGKPVYWVAEDALVFQALQKIRPSANLLIRPHLVDRDGAFVVVSGKTLERVVSSNRFLQDFAIALPKGTQVDMEGVDAASVLRNAVFFFLDELLSGMKMDFNTLRTIDTVARRIASAA